MTGGRCKKTIFGITSILMLATLFSADTTSATPATELNIDVLPVLSVSMSDISLHAEVNVLTTGASTLTIGSNNATGYNTFISSTSSETALIDSSEEYQIPALSSSTTLANFPTNAWGISMDGTNYAGIAPLNNSLTAVASLSPSFASTSIQDFHFAAKVDSTTPAGLYSNAILITVVPNYTPITLAESYNLAGKTRIFGNDGHKYYSMQDMNPTICNTADKEESTLRVADARDGKVYWITKLKDGNCWMTQNLDFDITATNVTPELSDVKVAWNSSSAYPPQATSTTIYNNSDVAGTYSYDPGDKYLPSGTGTATDIDCSIAENKENCHYHVGNYYQWNAATAGTGGTIVDADATGSICPKGWRLPTSNSATAKYSFGNLVRQYGYSGYNQDISDATLIASPIFATRSGDIYSSSVRSQGDYGRYWSSRAYADTNYAYGLYYVNSGSIYPSLTSYRYDGYNVRCIAHGNILSLTYNANGGTNAPSASVAESNSTSVTITIPSTIPTREHYNFLGWANSDTATTPDYVYNNGTFTPNSITISASKTLYAVWEESILYMQDVANWMDNLELEQQIQVIDNRDNKPYWVAKLRDGNIWMTQNLDYDIKATGNIISNNDGTTSIWSPNTATSTTVFSSTNATDTYSYDYGNKYIPDGTGEYTNIDCSTANGNENCHYHAGNLYQYNAATAGTGGTLKGYVDASSSICPKGWRLPASNSYTTNYSFGKLTEAYGITNGADGATDAAMLSAPLYFLRTGNIDSGTLTSNRNFGNYWAATTSSTASGAYNLYLRSTYTRVNSTAYRYQAYAIRCVAIVPTPLDNISTMQEMTSEIVASTPEGTTKQLVDTRDNKLYWVTKLADGNIWMTQNLDYDIKAGDNIISNLDGTTSIWNASSTYAPQATTTAIFSDKSLAGTYSYDPGSNYIPNGTGTPTAITCTSTSNGGENCHYHQGNYYQWNTATAGTGGTIKGGDATSSICPKGWRLPTSYSYTANYSFGKLTDAYGITNSADGTSDSALLISPLFFIHNGYIYNGSLRSQTYGGYWSSMAYYAILGTDNRAYILSFGDSSVSPDDNGGYRYRGYDVRCVAI